MAKAAKNVPQGPRIKPAGRKPKAQRDVYDDDEQNIALGESMPMAEDFIENWDDFPEIRSMGSGSGVTEIQAEIQAKPPPKATAAETDVHQRCYERLLQLRCTVSPPCCDRPDLLLSRLTKTTDREGEHGRGGI